MADKEFGKKCQRCGKTGGETFARVFYKPIDGKWIRLCGMCWDAVEQSFAPDRAKSAVKKSSSTTPRKSTRRGR